MQHTIISNEMSPTLIPGDRVVSNPFAFSSIKDVQRGQIILFENPEYPGSLSIKRVIALPGDQIKNGKRQIIVNDSIPQRRVVHLKESGLDTEKVFLFRQTWYEKNYLTAEYKYDYQTLRSFRFPVGAASYEVPEGKLYVLNDFWDESGDSRFIGTIPFENIKGKVTHIFWSLNEQTLELSLDRIWKKVDSF